MRVILFLIIPAFCFSQTVAERKSIVATYDNGAIKMLKEEARAKEIRQRAEIEAYLKAHQLINTEKRSLQRIEDGLPLFFTIFNDGSSKTINANKLYPGGSLGLNVTGSGITVGIWDGGKVRNTHVELAGKITLGDDADELSPHATHVTGTVMATGVSPLRRGIAYGASGITHDWDDDHSEMIDFAAQGYLVSNHSYGYSGADLPTWKFGSYDGSSIEIDQVANASPYYQAVIAAGNDRNDFDVEQNNLKGGYDLLSGTAVSKNGITVAAVEELTNYNDANDVMMSSFSNFGPPDDGRIKPDISAKGVETSSCVSTSNVAYDVFSGTSMAAPAISGMIALLQKHYNNLNPSTYMRASTVRGLICHSAREAGFWDGPDYEYGWGLADAAAAAQIITNKGTTSILEENNLANGETFTKQFAVSGTQDIAVTIAWTDPVGSANINGSTDSRSARLKNNLDLKVLKDGNIYYPWKMDPDAPTAEATHDSDNDVDNVEKVQIANAEPGVYTIQVTHKGTLSGNGGNQVFSLIANGTTALATNAVEFNDNIVLYPNPVRNQLGFGVPNNGEVTNVAIFDILGKQVKSASALIGNSIDLSDLAGGIYLARFTYNGASFTKKFIKE